MEFLRKCFKRKMRFLSIGSLFVILNRQEAFPSDFKTDVFNSLFLGLDDRLDILNSSQPPSFAQVALRVYSSLGQSSHSFFFLGDIGGGKSRCVKEFASHLILLSSLCRTDRRGSPSPSPAPPSASAASSSRKPSDSDLTLFEQANTILDSFGHCETPGNYRSSRYSRTVTLSFTDKGRLEGLTIRCHHLELFRTVSRPEGQSNFKIFSDVFDDIFFADQAASKYGIENLTSFRYTPQRPRAFAQPGKSNFKSLVAALLSLGGIPKVKQNVCVFNVLAAILHLGEIDLDANSGDSISFSLGTSVSSPFSAPPPPQPDQLSLTLSCRRSEVRRSPNESSEASWADSQLSADCRWEEESASRGSSRRDQPRLCRSKTRSRQLRLSPLRRSLPLDPLQSKCWTRLTALSPRGEQQPRSSID
jgi:hypothetical protein